ncbi:hypothetical protein ACMFMG_011182 [Clarireedia jacksonii]
MVVVMRNGGCEQLLIIGLLTQQPGLEPNPNPGFAPTSPRFQDEPTTLLSKTCPDHQLQSALVALSNFNMTPRQLYNLFHPSAFTPSRCPQSLQISKRCASSKSEPFILPRTAIDLDAPQNPAVREYNEEIDNIVPKKVLDLQKATARALRRRERIQNSPVQVRKWVEPEIISLDLLAYALFGKACLLEDNLTHRKMQDRLRRVLKQHAVNYEDTAELTVKKLTENFDGVEQVSWGGWNELEGGERELEGFRDI